MQPHVAAITLKARPDPIAHHPVNEGVMALEEATPPTDTLHIKADARLLKHQTHLRSPRRVCFDVPE